MTGGAIGTLIALGVAALLGLVYAVHRRAYARGRFDATTEAGAELIRHENTFRATERREDDDAAQRGTERAAELAAKRDRAEDLMRSAGVTIRRGRKDPPKGDPP